MLVGSRPVFSLAVRLLFPYTCVYLFPCPLVSSFLFFCCNCHGQPVEPQPVDIELQPASCFLGTGVIFCCDWRGRGIFCYNRQVNLLGPVWPSAATSDDELFFSMNDVLFCLDKRFFLVCPGDGKSVFCWNRQSFLLDRREFLL